MSSDTPPAPVLAERRGRSSLPFPVVGIGASSGGLTALTRLFERMPADPGMAFVVILHLSPRHESVAHIILQRVTALPVRQAADGVAIRANHVYVIPPSKHLFMEDDGRLRLGDMNRPAGSHRAIDLFFSDLGAAQGERAVAVVLSGSGADGSRGLRRIKECGGVTLVQSPSDSEHGGMPLSAMATGGADFVLPAADIPKKLLELWHNARQIQLPDPPADMHALEVVSAPERQNALEAFEEVIALLFERTGHDFRGVKRSAMLRRIERRMQVCCQATVPAYLRHMQAHPEEVRLLLQDLFISAPQFFRDREAFEALERVTSTEFGGVRSPQHPLRVWVVGCATGEEVYSVALLLMEQALAHTPSPSLQIFASDIDERAIATARTGLYSESAASDVAPGRLQQFFHHEDGQYRITKAVRARITFSIHDVLRDPPFSRIDLVCCRNLLVYLDREAQRHVLETLRYILNPGGILFLGAAETIDAGDDLFVPGDEKFRIYRPQPQ